MPPPVFLSPGVDPTEREYPLEGPTISGCLLKSAAIVAVAALVVGIVWGVYNANQAANAPTQTPAPTATPLATATPYPTLTPWPTYTAMPTWTAGPDGQPAPSFTPTLPPTKEPPTPTPTATPLPPDVLATWTPGPWLLTRFATERP